jgi:acetyltransferase-like isoleucine patch superfamily enzyme
MIGKSIDSIKVLCRNLYNTINKQYPAIGNIVRRIRFSKPLNSIAKNISGIDNVITYKNSILSSVVFKIHGDRNTIQIGDGCLLEGVTFSIHGNDHKIIIGVNCSFMQGSSLYLEDSYSSITIGEGTTMGKVHMASTEPGSKIVIGNDCMLAYNIDIRTGDSHSIISVSTGQRLNYAKDVVIGNHVWVAPHCVLLKGVHILDGSVVATGSIVTRKFDKKNVVIAGNPAVIVKEGVDWTRQRTYQKELT